MAGDGVEFLYDDSAFQKLIKAACGRIKNMKPAMKGFSEYMVLQTDKRFADQTDPSGKKWQKLSDVTLAAKAKDKTAIDKILQHGGYMRLVHPVASKDSAGVYSDKVYAAIHIRGGFAGPGRKVEIPKREFLGFNDDDIKEFIQTCTDYIILQRRA